MLGPLDPRLDDQKWTTTAGERAARASDLAPAPDRTENTAQVVPGAAAAGRRERIIMGPEGFKRKRPAQNGGAAHQPWFGKVSGAIGRLITLTQGRKG